MRRYVLFLLIVGYIVAIGYGVWKFEDSDAVLSIGWKEVIWLSLLSMTNVVLNGIFLREACRTVGCFLTKIEAVGLASASALLNYLPLRPGLGLKAVYLASVHRLPISGLASITGISIVLVFVCVGFLGAGASLWLLRSPDYSGVNLIVMAYAYGAMAACGLSMVVAGGYLDRVPLPSLVSRYAETLIRSIAALSRRRSFQVRAYPITLTILIVLAVRLYLVAGVLDSPVSAGEAILLGTAMAVSTLVNIMPAGLGVREVALSATFVALGGSVETGLMVAAADRLISLVLTALVGILWMVSARRQNRLSTSGEERERLTQEEALLQS